MQREKRSQFLAARLNATVALLQASEASIKLDNAESATSTVGPIVINYTSGRSHLTKVLEVSKLKQRISILLAEAGIDFDTKLWGKDLEREAIRCHFFQLLRELRSHCSDKDTVVLFPYFYDSLSEFFWEAKLLQLQFAHRHVTLCAYLGTLTSQKDHITEMKPEEINPWLGAQLAHMEMLPPKDTCSAL